MNCDLPNELQAIILVFLNWHLRKGKWIAPIAETKKQALLEKLNKNYTYSNSKIKYFTVWIRIYDYTPYMFEFTNSKNCFYYWEDGIQKQFILE